MARTARVLHQNVVYKSPELGYCTIFRRLLNVLQDVFYIPHWHLRAGKKSIRYFNTGRPLEVSRARLMHPIEVFIRRLERRFLDISLTSTRRLAAVLVTNPFRVRLKTNQKAFVIRVHLMTTATSGVIASLKHLLN